MHFPVVRILNNETSKAMINALKAYIVILDYQEGSCLTMDLVLNCKSSQIFMPN